MEQNLSNTLPFSDSLVKKKMNSEREKWIQNRSGAG
jgi:hypothetical protein